MISKEDDFEKLREITLTEADTASAFFSPSRRQFKRFIKQDGFSREESFRKVTGYQK